MIAVVSCCVMHPACMQPAACVQCVCRCSMCRVSVGLTYCYVTLAHCAHSIEVGSRHTCSGIILCNKQAAWNLQVLMRNAQCCNAGCCSFGATLCRCTLQQVQVESSGRSSSQWLHLTSCTAQAVTYFGATLCVADQLTICSPDTATCRGDDASKILWSSGFRTPQAKTPAMLAGSSSARVVLRTLRPGVSRASVSRPACHADADTRHNSS
jgi:hypothetical protein